MLSLYSTNKLLLENVPTPDAVDELSEEVMPIWPHGLSSSQYRRTKWRVEFMGDPWSCVGIDAIMSVAFCGIGSFVLVLADVIPFHPGLAR